MRANSRWCRSGSISWRSRRRSSTRRFRRARTGGGFASSIRVWIHSRAADEQLLRLILSNLLTNALKYSPPERAPSLTLTRVGRHAVFAIHDEGIGIPEEDRPALFQAFRRARNVGLVNGTGLGLYIVKHCVDLHEGTIELESAVGKGTTVTINLPMFPALTELGSTLNVRKGDEA